MCSLILRNCSHICRLYHTTAFIETTSLKTSVAMQRYIAHFLLVHIWPVLLGCVSFVYTRYDMVSFSGKIMLNFTSFNISLFSFGTSSPICPTCFLQLVTWRQPLHSTHAAGPDRQGSLRVVSAFIIIPLFGFSSEVQKHYKPINQVSILQGKSRKRPLVSLLPRFVQELNLALSWNNGLHLPTTTRTYAGQS